MVLHTGGLGDLVLNAELIAGLKNLPDRPHVTLICKAEMASVVELYPVPPDEIVRLECNPLAWSAPSDDLLAAFRPVLQELQSQPADVFIDATLQPSWLGWIAAAVVQAERACCCTAINDPHVFVSGVAERLGLKAATLERIGLPAAAHERERYRLLLRWMKAEPGVVFPWAITGRVKEDATRLLTELSLHKGEYLACFPCGSLGADAKRWPMANFREVLLEVHKKWALPILLVGENRERDALIELASNTTQNARVAVWCGGRDDIGTLAAALSHARIYLGQRHRSHAPGFGFRHRLA